MPRVIVSLLPACAMAVEATVFTVGFFTGRYDDFGLVTSVHVTAVLVKELQVFFDLSHPFFKFGFTEIG